MTSTPRRRTTKRISTQRTRWSWSTRSITRCVLIIGQFEGASLRKDCVKYQSQCAVAFFNQNQKTQKVWSFFWINTCYTNQNLSKKPSVNRAAKILQPKNHFLSDLLKNPKGGPFYVKKFFISDFDETQNLIYLGPKNSTHEIWAKSETKNFLTEKGPPFGFFSVLLKK